MLDFDIRCLLVIIPQIYAVYFEFKILTVLIICTLIIVSLKCILNAL